jgi:hypothetical protein
MTACVVEEMLAPNKTSADINDGHRIDPVG